MLEANLQLQYHHHFLLHLPVFLFSDDFQHVTRHETALLSARHSDEAASFALAAHADLTEKGIQFKTFKSGKYKHTVIYQKQIHADTVSEIIHINNNLVHAITAYLFRISSPGFACPENRETWRDNLSHWVSSPLRVACFKP